METFLWLISHFSCRIAVVLLSIPDALWLYGLYNSGELKSYVNAHLPLIILVSAITLLSSLTMAVIGGKAGYEYVDMERSRRWIYSSTAFSRGDSTFMNILYWACKFALLPIILVLLAFFVLVIIDFLSYCQTT